MKTILGLVVVAIIVVLVVAATKPDTYQVQRSIVVQAAPEKIYPLLDDFHAWQTWSPWAHLDPDMQVTYSGTHRGIGAEYAWKGNSKAGEGEMKMLQAEPNSHVRTRLMFLKPFKSEAMADFVLVPQGSGATQVTWTMGGRNTFFPGKVMSVFTSMDKVIGPDFERGLASLKTEAER